MAENLRRTLFLCFLFCCICQWGYGWILEERQKITASDPSIFLDRFGEAISLSGDTLLVGSSGHRHEGVWSGSAYVFRDFGEGWIETAELLASDGESQDYFGCAVSLSGEVALIGATADGDAGYWAGSAYVYRREGTVWIEEAKLLASDGDEHDWFGNSVFLSGDTAVVGAPAGGFGSEGPGAVYVFQYNGTAWVEETKLTASDGEDGDWFGRSICLEGDTLLIGAPKDQDSGYSSGSAYLFRASGGAWVEETKILASDGAAGDELGSAVSLSGDVALVGAHNDDDNGTGSGSAYVFHFNGSTWNEEAKLLASDGMPGDLFGQSVALDGEVALVGAIHVDSSRGAGYIFRHTGAVWSEQCRLQASDRVYDDMLGDAVVLSGSTALVGAPFDDYNDDSAGAVYIFRLFEPSVACEYICSPISGTLPFTTNMTVSLTNNYTAQKRRIAASIRVNLAGGQQWSNWKSGYTQLDPGQSYAVSWNQIIPALVSVVGPNVFHFSAEDVTPAPFNLPPYMPAGDTATDTCTVTGVAP